MVKESSIYDDMGDGVWNWAYAAVLKPPVDSGLMIIHSGLYDAEQRKDRVLNTADIFLPSNIMW